ncbi:MAG: L-lactate dehydrogenase [Clostridia bacterium]|nr:L-lactate dehydrogenase [Oscillospiraceae bacterium]MBR6747583.1 L-lactate dehydrogenase [Clostridia bacterium]
MSRKVTIIGAGNVGSTIAYTMAVTGLTSEIVMIDVNTAKALGETMDIRQGTPFCAPIKIYAGSYSDAAGSDVVIITSGIARRPGQTRIDLTQTNVNIIKSIAPEITRYAPDAVYVLVSNPVDILTYVFAKVSGLPENRVFGSGTLLDTARLRSRLAEYLSISQKNVHAYVLGEHGDSSFVPWSIASISNINLVDYRNGLNYKGVIHPDLDFDEIEKYIRTSGSKIIGRKGATFYAIAISVCHIIEVLLGSTNTVMAVSSMMHGEFGIDEVALSIPFIVGPGGIKGNVLPPLTDEEISKLQHSAGVLKDVISQITL